VDLKLPAKLHWREPERRVPCHRAMASSSSTPLIARERTRRMRPKSTLARPLAPEEIRRHAYVAVLYEIVEIPACFFCDDSALRPRDEMIRFRYVPTRCTEPMRVLQICLPFVLTKLPDGRRQTIDVRRCQLAELSRAYARAVRRSNKKSKVANGAAKA
jgi:hypothetical protein